MNSCGIIVTETHILPSSLILTPKIFYSSSLIIRKNTHKKNNLTYLPKQIKITSNLDYACSDKSITLPEPIPPCRNTNPTPDPLMKIHLKPLIHILLTRNQKSLLNFSFSFPVYKLSRQIQQFVYLFIRLNHAQKNRTPPASSSPTRCTYILYHCFSRSFVNPSQILSILLPLSSSQTTHNLNDFPNKPLHFTHDPNTFYPALTYWILPYRPPTIIKAQYSDNTQTSNAVTTQSTPLFYPYLLLFRQVQTQKAITSHPIPIPHPRSFHHHVLLTNPTLPRSQPQAYLHPELKTFSIQFPLSSSQTEPSAFSHPSTSIPPQVYPTLLQFLLHFQHIPL